MNDFLLVPLGVLIPKKAEKFGASEFISYFCSVNVILMMKASTRLFGLLAFLLVLPLASRATVWSAGNVPIPYLKDYTQHVSDPDGVLGRSDLDSANFYLGRLEQQLGVQSVVVIADSVADDDCFRMAQDVGNRYGVGTQKDRNGLVVVISLSARKYFIAPGQGLEGTLTDVDCAHIGRYCFGRVMRQEGPGKAVVALSKSLYNKVKSGNTGFEAIDAPGETLTSGDVAMLIILILCFIPPIVALVKWLFGGPGSGSGTHRRNDDDFTLPPFIFGGGGSLGGGGGGPIGGSFGGGSFGGGGAGGGW